MNVVHSNIKGRMNLPLVCNERGLTGTAVEIGTFLGWYAGDFLARWKGERFITIDDYNVTTEMRGDREIQRQEAMQRLEFFMPRCEMWHETSVSAAGKFADGSLDFIHIDGGHDYANTSLDIAAWWPKMKPGSIFTGHDYCGAFQGVVTAAQEHARRVNRDLHIIKELSGHNTWMIEV